MVIATGSGVTLRRWIGRAGALAAMPVVMSALNGCKRASPAAAAAVAGILAPAAMSQLTPDRAYYKIKDPIPMTVTIPAGAKGEAQLQLLEPDTAQVKFQAPVKAGPVDLAQLFPVLWDPPKKDPTDEDKARGVEAKPAPTPFYAQLVVGDKKVGPAVFVHPMVNQPTYELENMRDWKSIIALPTPSYFAGVRAWVDQHLKMETDFGQVEFRMRPDQAPNTVWNFMDLVRNGFYTNIDIYRIINDTPELHNRFAIQAGDPISTGGGGPGYSIDLEVTAMPFDYGVLGMLHAQRPNTGGSQFFIGLSRVGTQFLDGKYTGFGQLVAGAETIEKMTAETPVDEAFKPKGKMPQVKRAWLVPAPPYGDGPKPITEAPAKKSDENQAR